MVRNIYDNEKFYKAICENELVYLFGTGISSALTGKEYGWYSWIIDGIQMIKSKSIASDLKNRLDADMSADNMINVVSDVINALKDENLYEDWMKESFESNHVSNLELAKTLRKFLIPNDIIATTNYDRLIEEATNVGSLSYEDPEKIFSVLKYKRLKAVIHIHGLYDSVSGLDNIIADKTQYESILDNKGAQFLQNLLGTRTVIFIGCGKTTEDANISRFINFSHKWLKMNVDYYYLHDASALIEGLPGNIIPVCYGDDHSELPTFLEKMICERIKAKIERHRIVGRTIFSSFSNDIYGLSEYHYSREYLKFCGRKKELSSLGAFLENNASCLWWAITGQAGAGKSRLAFELMHKMTKSYFGFFINPSAKSEDVKSFVPFSDTLVVFDYVRGNETCIAEMVTNLFELYKSAEYDGYKLRIIFVEREKITISGTWYYALEQAFSYYDRTSFKDAEYKPHLSNNEHDFICLDDLDDESVVELIGEICLKKGLPSDRSRDNRLRDEYAAKFEQLRFRPLFLQLYVQAWIENGKSNSDYRNYRDILKAVLNKEKEHLMMSVKNDKRCGESLIRLLVRAGISPLYENSIPEAYKHEWEDVCEFVKNDTLPGFERKEELYALFKDASHGIETDSVIEEYVIDPLYPDIIKEAFFLQYVDDMESFGNELWNNAPVDYSLFLYRCAIDFSDDNKLKDYIKSQTIEYDNIPAMYARLSLLHHEVITIDDNPKLLLKEIDEEFEYWLNAPTNGNNATELMSIRLEGLHDSLLMFFGWSNAKMIPKAIEELANTPDNPALKERKCQYLLDATKYLTDGGKISAGSSEYVLEHLTELVKDEDKNSQFYHTIILSMESFHIINSVLLIRYDEIKKNYHDEDWESTIEMLNMLRTDCNLSCEQDVEIYAYTVDRCTSLAFEKLAGGYINDFFYKIQDYAVEFAQSNGELAFNDRIHFYYLHAKLVYVEAISISSSALSGNCGYANSIIDEYIDEIENNEMVRDFSGLLVGAWALKVGFDDQITDADVYSYIETAENYMCSYSDSSLLAEKYFDLLLTALEYQLKRPANKKEVEFGYSIALRFPLDAGVLKGFFELLKNSSEYRNWREYLDNKQIRTGLVQNNLVEYLDEVIPASLGPTYPNPVTVRKNAFLQSVLPKPSDTYFRRNKKIGANDPCPCGSGLKFKRCCRGKGYYD